VAYRFTKPQTFADCIGNELPLGWEEAYDPQIGCYYINHVNRKYTVLAVSFRAVACLMFVIIIIIIIIINRLCGLVVRVLGYRSGGPGSIPGTTRKKK
jgi:hypothetical protein